MGKLESSEHCERPADHAEMEPRRRIPGAIVRRIRDGFKNFIDRTVAEPEGLGLSDEGLEAENRELARDIEEDMCLAEIVITGHMEKERRRLEALENSRVAEIASAISKATPDTETIENALKAFYQHSPDVASRIFEKAARQLAATDPLRAIWACNQYFTRFPWAEQIAGEAMADVARGREALKRSRGYLS